MREKWGQKEPPGAPPVKMGDGMPPPATSSRYGKRFDERADEWACLENDHDKMHPGRDQCGGVGGCPMMREAVGIEQSLIELLESWRAGCASMTPEHQVDYGHFGWRCTCGAGTDWPLAPVARARAASDLHLRAVNRRALKEAGR